MEIHFLKPIDDEIVGFLKKVSTQQLGSKIVFHTKDAFPDLKKIRIAIIGVLENRGENKENIFDLNLFRKELYSLYPGNWEAAIADFGDVLAGETINDTYFAVQSIVSDLLKINILPIIIGGSQDITYPLYRAYDNFEQMVNLASIDSEFDFGKESEPISAKSYLTKIVLDEPNNLFNFCNIGFQTYFNSQEEIDLIEKLFFDAYRLGDISSSLHLAEPVLRDSDLVSIDFNSIKSSDKGTFNQFSPNGFSGKEICALSRYAGLSDKVTLLGIFNHSYTRHEFVLMAQVIWYFIEGFHYRSKEYPFGSKESYLKYIVPLEDDELVFYKSDRTERWWIEIPFVANQNNKLTKTTLLPCSYDEYLKACNQELPERWWKAIRKNAVLRIIRL